MKVILGIDPGINGALVILNPENEEIYMIDMPTHDVVVGGKSKKQVCPITLAASLKLFDGDEIVAYLERVNAMPGQGVTSMFNFGRSYGVIEGVLGALNIKTNYVSPVVWKKALNLPAGKDAARQRAVQLFPHVALDFRLAKHDGRAEAALIAVYGTKQ